VADLSTCVREYSHTSQAYYASSALRARGDKTVDEIIFGLYSAEDTTEGEMALRWLCFGGRVCLQLEVLGDAFGALHSFSDVIAELARVSQAHGPVISAGEFCALLGRLGFRDVTLRCQPAPEIETLAVA
jgi:hypothetical protein